MWENGVEGEGKGREERERRRGREGRELPRAPRMLGPALGMHKRFCFLVIVSVTD